jgi:hypothetical protein
MFERFWHAYPRRQHRKEALKAWRRLAPDLALCRVMSAALQAQARSDQWTRDGGRYIPLASSWLNGRYWEDELGPQAAESGQEARAPRYVRTEIIDGKECDIYE